MPDIAKINAVAIADIEKVDGILAANIEKVNGLTFATAPAITAPLAAYSVRLLDTAVGVPTYTGSAMRVREDSGDTETDIGFDTNGDLDTAAIATHCGTANGFVVTWYDQSGNGNDAEQPTAGGAALQPKIYDGTTQAVITKQGKPCVYFGVTSTANLSAGNIWTDADGPVSGFAVLNIDTTQTGSFLGRWLYMDSQSYHWVDAQWRFLDGGLASVSSPAPAIDTDYLVTFFHKVNSSGVQDLVEGAINGGTFNSANGYRTLTTLKLGGGQYNLDANLKEVIVWNTGQNDNRTAIESDINTYFSIY